MAFWRRRERIGAGQSRGIETDLRDILARVELIQPVWNTEQYEQKRVSPDYKGPILYYDELSQFVETDPFLAVTYQEMLLDNTEAWRVSMTLVQNTPDGELKTYVHSSAHVAIVSVALDSVGRLTNLFYKDEPFATCGRLGFGWSVSDSEQQVSPVAVLHLREWVRRRILPKLETAKRQRELIQRERSERERQGDLERSAKLEAMRRKYLS